MNGELYDDTEVEEYDLLDDDIDMDVDQDIDMDFEEDMEYFGEEDYDDDYLDDGADSAEGRRSRSYYRRRRAIMRRRAIARRARARARSRYGYGRRYTTRRPRRRPRYFPTTTRRPPSTTKVRKAFSRASSDIQKNNSNIKKVDLDNKVQSDTFGRALKSQGERISGNEYAQSASKVIDELRERFPDLFKNEVLKTALQLAPLLFLKPETKDGLGGVISDPRVWGPVLAAAAAIFSETQDKNKKTDVKILPDNATVANGASIHLSAIVRDSNGQFIVSQPIFTWTSLTPSLATVKDGLVAGVSEGVAFIQATATVEGKSVSQVAVVQVTAAAAAAAGAGAGG